MGIAIFACTKAEEKKDSVKPEKSPKTVKPAADDGKAEVSVAKKEERKTKKRTASRKRAVETEAPELNKEMAEAVEAAVLETQDAGQPVSEKVPAKKRGRKKKTEE